MEQSWQVIAGIGLLGLLLVGLRLVRGSRSRRARAANAAPRVTGGQPEPLTEAAAWKHILPAARRLQREYRSWEELSRKFMIGRHYWGEGEATQARFDAAAAWLLGDPASPWRRLAWTTPLDVAESSRGAPR